MNVAMLSCIACVLLSLAGEARAQDFPGPPPPPPRDTAHRHDGFFLRTHIGPAYTHMSADGATIKGNGGGFGLAIGGAVQDNLIVYGELFDDVAVGPEIEIDGLSGEAGEDTAAGVVGVGVGLAYYIMPANVYVSGTLTSARLTTQVDGEQIGQSDFGLGLSGMLGKEWWVSDNWGLGFAAQAFVGQMKDKDDGPTFTTMAAAVVLSATYN